MICCDDDSSPLYLQCFSQSLRSAGRLRKVLFSDYLGQAHRRLLARGDVDLILPMAVSCEDAKHYLYRLMAEDNLLIGNQALDDAALIKSFLPDLTDLTKRERSVLTHIQKGLTNAGIAEQMAIHINTVKVHIARICRKTGVRNRTHAASICGQQMAAES